ncbi:MAG: transcriptional repressor LexA [Candidatus Paceibacterota bacterium]|jgi:repressor LexA
MPTKKFIITRRQKEILDFILDFMDENGYSPSLRVIGKAMGLSSPSSVHEQIKKLQEAGFLEREDDSRSFLPSGKALNLTEKFSVPVLGTIAAGSPIQVFEYQENLMIPKTLISNGHTDLFALEVKGNSMIEEGIMDGDYVICEPSQNVKNGDVVVALVNGTEVTLKKFYKEKRWIRLMPANSKMRPILSRNVLVQGVVKAVFRKY